jgi:hypothetical protein
MTLKIAPQLEYDPEASSDVKVADRSGIVIWANSKDVIGTNFNPVSVTVVIGEICI